MWSDGSLPLKTVLFLVPVLCGFPFFKTLIYLFIFGFTGPALHGAQGLLLVVLLGLLLEVPSLVSELGLWAGRLSGCGAWAYLLHGVCNFPG